MNEKDNSNNRKRQPLRWVVAPQEPPRDVARERFVSLWDDMWTRGLWGKLAFWRAYRLYRLYCWVLKKLIHVVQRDGPDEATLVDIAVLWLLLKLPAIYLWLHRLIVRRNTYMWYYGYADRGYAPKLED
jgi:hypothetical protein